MELVPLIQMFSIDLDRSTLEVVGPYQEISTSEPNDYLQLYASSSYVFLPDMPSVLFRTAAGTIVLLLPSTDVALGLLYSKDSKIIFTCPSITNITYTH